MPSSDVREMAPQTQGSAAPEHHQTRSQMSVHDDAINEEIMREREEEIRGIHQTVTKVNEVFKDLADIVHEQQQEIDAVQSMIGRSHEHAQSGLRQVEKVSLHMKPIPKTYRGGGGGVHRPVDYLSFSGTDLTNYAVK